MSRKIKVYLDTNVLLDVLSLEPRIGKEASTKVFQAIRLGLVEGELSTQSILDAYYIINRGKSDTRLSEKLLQLMNYINIGYIDSFNIREALLTGKGDFEDDAQYACATDGCCDVFLSGDKDFRKKHEGENKHIQFFTPEEFIAKLTDY